MIPRSSLTGREYDDLTSPRRTPVKFCRFDRSTAETRAFVTIARGRAIRILTGFLIRLFFSAKATRTRKKKLRFVASHLSNGIDCCYDVQKSIVPKKTYANTNFLRRKIMFAWCSISLKRFFWRDNYTIRHAITKEKKNNNGVFSSIFVVRTVSSVSCEMIIKKFVTAHAKIKTNFGIDWIGSDWHEQFLPGFWPLSCKQLAYFLHHNLIFKERNVILIVW